MPAAVPAVIAAVGTASAAAVPAAGLTVAGLAIPSFVATAGIGLITTGLQFGAQLLFAPDDPARPSASRQIGALPPLGTRYIAIGKVRTGVERGAHIVHHDPDDDDTFWQFVVASYDRVSNITAHYIDGEEVTLNGSGFVTSPTKWANNLIRIQTRGGGQSAALSTATTAFSYWTANHIGQGISYAAIQQKPVAASKFPSVYVNHRVQYSADVEGALLPEAANPSATSYSNNAARAVLWHLTDSVAGYGLTEDKLNLPSFVEYAAYCDELRPLNGGGTEKRYTANGFVDLGERKIDTLLALLANCDADLVTDSNGRLQIVRYNRPAIYTLEPSRLISMQMQAGVPEEQRTNAVVASYVNPDLSYSSTTTPPLELALRPGEARITGTAELPFCTQPVQAQVLAKKALYRANPIASGKVSTKLGALHLRPTDSFDLPPDDDLIGADMRIQRRELVLPQAEGDPAPYLTFEVAALDPEYDIWVPSVDEQDVSAPPATNDNGDIIDPPNITATSVVQVQLSGAEGSAIEATYDTESSDLVAEIEWSIAGDDEYEGPRRRGAQVGTIRTSLLEEGQDYDIRMRFVLRSGTGATDWTEETGISVTADAVAPAQATVSASTGVTTGAVDVSVTAPSDSNYYRVLIKHATVTGSETFAGATTYGYVLINQAGGSASFTISGLGSGTNTRVYAQAQNLSGVGPASPNSSTATAGTP